MTHNTCINTAGPCGVNEVTCHVSGYGDEGLLTFDWKHFPYEDYDDYLWGKDGLWKDNSTERVPDILTVQFGLHSCWHAHPEGLYSHHLPSANKSMLLKHTEDVSKLFKAIDNAIKRRLQPAPLVIVLTSGWTYIPDGSNVDECIQRMNRVAATAAHAHGFAVLERGEIERRLMLKSLQSDSPIINPEIHLAQPAQNIIATCLLRMLNCLNTTSHDVSDDVLGNITVSKTPPPPQPLHSPP